MYNSSNNNRPSPFTHSFLPNILPSASILFNPMSFHEIHPFFEPGAPSLARPTLLARTEIGKMYVPDKPLAQEELGPNPTRREHSKVRFSPYLFKSNKQNTKHPSVESESELSSLTSSDSEDEEEDLIPKPEGEAGRPGRGGYNVEDALGWPRKEYRQLKVVHYSQDRLKFLTALNRSTSRISSMSSLR
jgi:hypothetical protein